MKMPNLATRVFNTPLAIMPEKAEAIVQALGSRFGLEGFEASEIKAGLFGEDDKQDEGYRVENGIAVISVQGTLVHKSSWLDAMCGLTSYETLSEYFRDAMNDSAIKGVFLDMDSPGGEVSGLFDLVDDMASHVGKKPIHAHVNELSASASYAITTVADHITIPRTGIAGSIGVIMLHSEMSRRLDKDGIAVNVIRAGKRKAEGNPYEALSKEARESFQRDLDYIHDIFVKTVSRNMEIDEKLIWETEAACFNAPDALKLGLVDAVNSTAEAADKMLASVG